MVVSDAVKLYAFDEDTEGLELVPLAARRALDHAGLKMSRKGWRSLPLAARRSIVDLGSARTVDVATVARACKPAEPAAERGDVVEDPPAKAPPQVVTQAFGTERPIADAVWAGLSPLDRYVLWKVASKGRPERMAAAYQEIVGASALSTHLAPGGGVRMVDVAEKIATQRTAIAESRVTMGGEAFARLERADAPKGDVLGTARLAGIMAAKRTADLIPLCHPIALTRVAVELKLEPGERSVHVTATVEAFDRTGVEMEALVAASTAALTVYDMLKAFDRSMQISGTRLVAKSGGRSGDYRR